MPLVFQKQISLTTLCSAAEHLSKLLTFFKVCAEQENSRARKKERVLYYCLIIANFAETNDSHYVGARVKEISSHGY